MDLWTQTITLKDREKTEKFCSIQEQVVVELLLAVGTTSSPAHKTVLFCSYSH